MSSQDSDEEGYCQCAPDVKLPRISYFKQRNCFKSVAPVAPDGWIRIGKVKQLFIYPIECGTGFEQSKVVCTKNGPEFDTFNDNLKEIKDRRLAVYKIDDPHHKGGKDVDSAVHLSPTTNITNCDKKAFYYGKAKEFEDGGIAGERIIKRKFENVADIPLVRRPGDEEDLKLQKLVQRTSPDYRLGYFTAKERRKLSKDFRFTKENKHIDGMLPYYSHFTLINTKSVEYLAARFKRHTKKNHQDTETAKEISSKNFFPHIVMEGDPCSHFQEDSVKHVKIGNVEFGNILPCVQSENVNYDHNNPEKPFQRLRIYLEKHRQVRKIFNELDEESERPVFGINMEKIDVNLPNDADNIICENDVVYVKY